MSGENKLNELLREARERTASPANPEECLSRQELAELANSWIWKQRKKIAALNANYIGQLERGYICWPGRLTREALRAVLGASTDAALGFVNTRRAVVKLDDVKRRKFIDTATNRGSAPARRDVSLESVVSFGGSGRSGAVTRCVPV